MREGRKDLDNSRISTDDGWNRTFYGSPTIGGFLVVAAIVLYCLFKL